VKVVAYISLADLLVMEGSSALQEEWIASARAAWLDSDSYRTRSECLSCGDSGREARTIVLSSQQLRRAMRSDARLA